MFHEYEMLLGCVKRYKIILNSVFMAYSFLAFPVSTFMLDGKASWKFGECLTAWISGSACNSEIYVA